jgi:hypothetical protein
MEKSDVGRCDEMKGIFQGWMSLFAAFFGNDPSDELGEDADEAIDGERGKHGKGTAGRGNDCQERGGFWVHETHERHEKTCAGRTNIWGCLVKGIRTETLTFHD